MFAWHTGITPQHIRIIEPRHIAQQYKRVVIPMEETKRKNKTRAIYSDETAREIIERRKNLNPVFQTVRGLRWNKDRIANWFTKMNAEVGKKYSFYDLRHARFTRMLTKGIAIADLAELGGTSVAMITKTLRVPRT